VLTFKFVSLGRKKYEKLIKEFPPTAEQIAEAHEKNEEAPPFNDSFVYALIDASCTEPTMDPGELRTWLEEDPEDEWSLAETQLLFEGALAANTSAARLDLGKGLR
jgi:hypothetical protein